MWGLSKAIDSVRSKFRQAASAAANAVRSAIRSVSGRESGFVRIEQTGLDTAVGTTKGLVTVLVEGDYPESIARMLAESTVENIRRAVEPITRSGRLRDSFRIEPVPGGYAVVSDVAYASSLLDSSAMNAGRPHTSALMDWMQYKAEFSGLTEQEKLKAAFAIRQAIIKKKTNPAGNSTILGLQPRGERAYDYLSVALTQTLAQYASSGISIRSVVD